MKFFGKILRKSLFRKLVLSFSALLLMGSAYAFRFRDLNDVFKKISVRNISSYEAEEFCKPENDQNEIIWKAIERTNFGETHDGGNPIAQLLEKCEKYNGSSFLGNGPVSIILSAMSPWKNSVYLKDDDDIDEVYSRLGRFYGAILAKLIIYKPNVVIAGIKDYLRRNPCKSAVIAAKKFLKFYVSYFFLGPLFVNPLVGLIPWLGRGISGSIIAGGLCHKIMNKAYYMTPGFIKRIAKFLYDNIADGADSLIFHSAKKSGRKAGPAMPASQLLAGLAG